MGTRIVPEGISCDIALVAEVDMPAGQSGPTKSSADTTYPLSQISSSITPVCTCSVPEKICLAVPVITSSGGGIADIGWWRIQVLQIL